MVGRMKKILIIGEDTRSFLTCIRSFGRNGFEVHVCLFELKTAALASKYVKAVHALPSYTGDGSDWRLRMLKLIETYQFDAILPCDERALLPLVELAPQLDAAIWLGLPNDAALSVFFSKEKTREVALQLGIPVASGFCVSLDQNFDVPSGFSFPVAVKAVKSFSLDSLHVRNSVKFADTEIELRALVNTAKGDRLLIEEMFKGDGVGVSVLSQQGVVLTAFQHKRINAGIDGNSAYRVSQPLSKSLSAAVGALCAEVEFSGIAMFEFKVQHPDSWILLEVNARPWGSIPLPVALGIDFPFWWYATAKGVSTNIHSKYSFAHYGRNLFADYFQLRQSLRSKTGLVAKLSTVAPWLFSFWRCVVLKESIDTFTVDDPRPARSEISQFLKLKLGLSGIPKLRETNDRIIALVAKSESENRPVHIEFVCYGNICRSPFAMQYLRGCLAESGSEAKITYSSSGMLPVAGRGSPSNAIVAAQRRGLSLENHRSRYASAEVFRKADLIFVFDKKVFDSVCAQYDGASEKLFNLAHMNDSAEIADPYGHELAVFDLCFSQIETAIQRLLEQTNRRSGFVLKMS
jgi:protein-tyrosine-phosphatase/predicted ATP-grasp superfamily ATP-dependent carboligase